MSLTNSKVLEILINKKSSYNKTKQKYTLLDTVSNAGKVNEDIKK